MKKLLMVALIGLLCCTAVFADHPQDTVGIGGVTNFGWGSYDGYFNPGLSLKVSKVPIYWGFFANIYPNTFGVGVTGDYYIFDRGIVDTNMTNEDGTYRFKLDWYLGAGLFANTVFWRHGTTFDMGLRVPTGVSWHIIEKLELFLGIIPGFGFSVWNSRLDFFWAFSQEVGVRYWF